MAAVWGGIPGATDGYTSFDHLRYLLGGARGVTTGSSNSACDKTLHELGRHVPGPPAQRVRAVSVADCSSSSRSNNNPNASLQSVYAAGGDNDSNNDKNSNSFGKRSHMR